MAGIIWGGIKSAPRLFWQSIFQPTKVYDFLIQKKKNAYVFIWAYFFSGLILGSGLAILHYYYYIDLTRGIIFAFSFAFALASAIIVAIALTVPGSDTVLGPGSGAISFAAVVAFTVLGSSQGLGSAAFAVVFSGAFAFLGAAAADGSDPSGKNVLEGSVGTIVLFIFTTMIVGLVGTIVVNIVSAITDLVMYFVPDIVFFPIILFLSALGWLVLYLNDKDKIALNSSLEIYLIIFAMALIILAGRSKITSFKSYQLVICLCAFLIGYFFSSSFEFEKKNKDFKENFKHNETKDEDVTHLKFRKAQGSSLIWGPVIAVLFLIPIFLGWVPKFHSRLIIAACGFSVMPIFILHIPDYLLCLPLWYVQRRKILRNREGGEEMVCNYKHSLLFKHQRIYLQLPGLHKIMVFFARNRAISIKETVKHINHLYWFTFQQKQAQKSVVELVKNRDTAHPFILFLLEEKNLPLLHTLAHTNRLAGQYLMLFEKSAQQSAREKGSFSISLSPGKRFFPGLKQIRKRRDIPDALEERVALVCREMAGEEGYRFNEEMVKTLDSAYKFLTAKSLKEFFDASAILDQIRTFPEDVPYFPVVETLAGQLKRIKDTLDKVGDIQRYESKLSVLHDQRALIDTPGAGLVNTFPEPFKEIWQRALNNCSKLISEEGELLRGTADLSIELKNSKILASHEERKLYVQIRNKGRELGTDISITLQADSPMIGFPGHREAQVAVIEPGAEKEIFFPITAHTPIKTTVSGTLTFSDRARENKTVSFSFPVTILEKSVRFKEIKNPYIVGQPLKGDTPIFFGREDVFGFIDKNIMASGDFHSIVCHGLRRTGKSSLLYRIEEQGFTDKNLVPINLDMQGIDDEKDFYSTLSNTILEKLSLPARAAAENFTQFKAFIKKIKPGLGERVIVLMVDEFEELQMRVEEKRISKTMFSNLRHLMQHEEKLAFLFCGTHKLEEMSADYWSIFFNTALYLRISHLKRKDAVRLIKEPVKGQLTYDDLAVEQILKMTGGQPYLIQLICRTLVNDLNENKKRNDALINDVDDAVEKIISEGTDHFSRHIRDESNLLERLILSVAAEEMTHKQLDHIGVDAIFDRIKPHIPDFSRKQSLETLETLVSKEILAETNLRYGFPVNLLRKWIAARYPLRKVREEI